MSGRTVFSWFRMSQKGWEDSVFEVLEVFVVDEVFWKVVE